MKKHLLKTMLLVTAMVFGATSAWADDYFTQNYEGEGITADWTTGTNGRFTPTILEEEGNHFLSVEQGQRNNNGTTIKSTSLQDKVAAGTDFTMEFDLRISSSTNQTPVTFKIYDAANSNVMFSLTAGSATYSTTWTINEGSTNVTLHDSNKGGGTQTIADVPWFNIKFSRSGELTYVTIKDVAADTLVFEQALVDTKSETGGLGKMEFVTKRYNANFALDNIVVRSIADGEIPQSKATTYTVKYIDESNNTIKEDEVLNTIVGIEVSASANQIAPIYTADKKYIYVSGNETITTAEDGASNVITLVFREAAVWKYTVKAMDANENLLATLISSEGFEADQLTVGYPLYVLTEDGTLMTKGATNKEYRTSFTLTSDNQEIVLTYAAPETAIENVIFYTEGENIEGVSLFNTGNSQIRSSNAASAYTAKELPITKLAVGKYKISAVVCNAKGNANFDLKLGNRVVLNITGGANNWISGSAEFVVAKETDLTFIGGNSNQGLDYVYIQQLPDPTEEEMIAAIQADAAADAAKALADAKAELNAAITEAKALVAEWTGVEGVQGLDAFNGVIMGAEFAANNADADLGSIEAAKEMLQAAQITFKAQNPNALMKEAQSLAADAEAVAVGKLIDAIAEAKETGEDDALAAAVEQFKKDNEATKMLGEDLTAKVGTSKESWTGAGGTAGSVTTSLGTQTALAELYASAGAGTKMSQTITGLENGLYRVKVFATSHNARGEDGATLNGTSTEVAYVFAQSGETTNKTWITASGVTPGFLEGEQTNPYTIDDIEVADGNLTIGLTVDMEKQTGWHTIQIYSLNKVVVVTAKEAFAAVKGNMTAEIAAARAMEGENGKEELNAAIATAEAALADNHLNIADMEAAIAALIAAEKEFQQANLPLREGEYYAYDAQTGKFLSRGAAYGTQAVVDNYGVALKMNVKEVSESAIKYQLTAFDNNACYGFDDNMYGDASGNNARTFVLTASGEGFTLTNTNNNKFMAVREDLTVTGSSDAATVWQFLTKEQRDEIVAANETAQQAAAFSSANIAEDAPLTIGEATTLTFATGNTWTQTVVRTQDGQPATNDNGTEMWQATGNYTQTVSDLPSGLYKVSIQAFYRNGSADEDQARVATGYNTVLAYLEANGNKVQVKSWTSDKGEGNDPNSMVEAKAKFDEGKYLSEVYTYVGEDGNLNLTVNNPAHIGNGWFIASNVSYQKVSVDELAQAKQELAAAVAEAKALDENIYTEDTYEAVSKAITAAENALAAEDATVESLQAAQSKLEKAIGKLVTKAAQAVIDAKTDLMSTIYTAEDEAAKSSKNADVDKALADAITAAKAVYDNAEATLEQVNQAITDLNAAINTYKNWIANGIDSIHAAEKAGKVYNMNGQKVQKTQKGLYIINGKAVIVK